MKAVNLIPPDGRRRGPVVSVSLPTLGLVGALLLALVGTVLYVSAANAVASRKHQLAQVTAGVAAWTAAARSYEPYVTAAAQREKQLADVRQLARSRFPWSQLLGQIGGLMPDGAALSTLQAADSDGSGDSSSPPTVKLSGCAVSQSTVAQAMTQLHEVSGVSDVTLASTSRDDSSGSSDSAASGACAYPVQFELALTLNAAAALASASGTSAASPAAPAASSAPAGSTSAAAQ